MALFFGGRAWVLEYDIGVGVSVFEAQIHSAGLRASAMDHAGRDCERLSRLQPKRPSVGKVDFQLAFQNKETFIRTRMLMPAELPLHHSHSHAMVVHVENHEILVGLLYRKCFALQVYSG